MTGILQGVAIFWLITAVFPAYVWSRDGHPTVTFGGMLVLLTIFDLVIVGMAGGLLFMLANMR